MKLGFATSTTHRTASSECSDSKPNQTKLFQRYFYKKTVAVTKMENILRNTSHPIKAGMLVTQLLVSCF